MAGGWARDGAVQDQIDASIKDAVSALRSKLPKGSGSEECEECGEPIPLKRREAIPGVSTCVSCQEELESRPTELSGINRKASKDSQLK